jgi:hypothetical protein
MSWMSRRVPAAAVALLLSAPAWSQFSAEEVSAANNNPGAYSLDENTITIQRVGPVKDPPLITSPGDPSNVLPDIADIINIGLKVWQIVQENEAVVNVSTQYATALPSGIKNWTDMAGWQEPTGEIYEMTAKNGLGMQVVDLRYEVLRTYGGSYDGQGQYLTAVTVQPLNIDVAWGFHFSLISTVPDAGIVNVGTSEDPVAGLTEQLAWTIASPVKSSSGESVYYMQGDGVYREVAGPFSNAALAKARAVAAPPAKPTRFD